MKWCGFRRNRHPFVCLSFAGAIICLCILSTKFLLFIVAAILIALGIMLLRL